MFKLILYRLHHLLYDDLRWASSKNKYTSMLPNPILQFFMFLGKKILMKKRIHFFPLTKNCWQPRFSWDDTYSIRGIVVGVIKVNSEIVVITAFVTTRRVGGKKINGKSYRRHGLMHAIFGLSNFNWLLTKKRPFFILLLSDICWQKGSFWRQYICFEIQRLQFIAMRDGYPVPRTAQIKAN